MNALTFLRESTWGYPIISAVHVSAIAWFGGTILVSGFAPDLRTLRRAGLGLLLLTGAILFALHPEHYYQSIFFRVKLLLLLMLIPARRRTVLWIGLWAAIIFASRGIAFL